MREDVDRLGRQIAVTNGANICNYTYNGVNQILTERYTGGALDGLSVTNGYDNLLRRNELAIINSQSAILVSTASGYDPASRLSTVSDGNGNTATYSYLANSPLVGQIAFSNSGQTVMTTTKQYDFLNRLTAIQSSAGGGLVASFNYQYNSANQRTQVTNVDSSSWVYQYDRLGQVISGRKYWANGTPVAGQQFTYNFDDIGNRQSTASGGDASGNNLRSANYAANHLNQYTSRDVPGYTTVLGSANTNATVTVNLQRAVRQGNYFWDELAESNGSSPLYVSLTNLAVLNNGTNADLVATNVGKVFLPQSPEAFGYDPDGNLTNDGRWSYTWDAENRLLRMTANTSVEPQYELAFAYDYQGRRIQKTVSTNTGSVWLGVYTNRFVYDGWNVMAILNSQSSILQSFTWGSDLSGSLQGAGGVGGLLGVNCQGNTATNCFVAFDGNGNLAALVNTANGAILASYEYGPFGEVIRATGPMAKANPIRFSTKYQDDETGLNYYGYRYYDPSAGRWLGRDPIGEEGNMGLYGFVGNQPVNLVDLFGLQSWLGPGYGALPTPSTPPTPDPLNAEAWQMFLHLMAGDMGENYQLSSATEQAIEDRVAHMEDTTVYLRKNSTCGKSGTASISINQNNFSIETGDISFVNMGSWQIRIRETARWKCDNGNVSNGKCCCQCKADVDAHVFISKTYTFRPNGYNPANAWLPIRILNGVAKDLQYYDQWYHDSEGPAYFVSDELKFTFSVPYRKCTSQ